MTQPSLERQQSEKGGGREEGGRGGEGGFCYKLYTPLETYLPENHKRTKKSKILKRGIWE